MSDPSFRRFPEQSAARRGGVGVLRGALLGNLHDAGVAVLQVAGEQGKDALFALPALREKLIECLETMRSSALHMPEDDKAEMSGIDWAAWENLQTGLSGSSREWRERMWQVVHQLVPVTLVEVRRYRRRLPGWFDI